MMSQFPAFFHGSVRDNFLIAKADATDAEIQLVCEQTGLWSLLRRVMSEHPLQHPFAAGMYLSGGQQRLFALTRCLLRDPSILFLDEPTTNMSNDEKILLIPIIRKACRDKTVVVVDHDIAWLTQLCDHFVVLDSGKVVQEGTSYDLASTDGIFRQLFVSVPRSQSSQFTP